MHLIDRYRLMHWLNARKMPIEEIERLTESTLIRQLLEGKQDDLSLGDVNALARTLGLSLDEFTREGQPYPSVIHMSHEELLSTRREVRRGGRHYYTYYSLPGPTNSVVPVLIDILSRPNEELVQNNGHLEPAITVNLGPGDIVGEWKRGGHFERRLFEANHDSETNWISGDSYFEPPYFPHTYGLAGLMPARILSYTVRSNLEPLVHQMNRWPESSVQGMRQRLLDNRVSRAALLGFELMRRGYNPSVIESHLGLAAGSVEEFTNGSPEALSLDDLRRVAGHLGIDYRTLLDSSVLEDDLCRVWLTIADSLRTTRPFGAYSVASVAMSVRCPQASGFFMRVENRSDSPELDLCSPAACHYLVNGGELELILSENTEVVKFNMKKDDSVWIAPFVQHAFWGVGALLRMDNADGLGGADYLELTNTADLTYTLGRAYRDLQPWTPPRL